VPPLQPCASSARSQSHRDDVERLGEQIAELAAQIHAATYQLLVMIREFDEREGWEGFASCAHWLNWRAGIGLGAAREKVRVARALAGLPRLSAEMEKGLLSYSKVRALTRVANEATEEELLEFARAGTAAHVEKLVRAWRRADRLAEAEEEERRHQSRGLRAWVDEDGMVVVRGRLTPEAGAALMKALQAAGEKLYRAADEERRGEVSAEQRRADALGLVAESALAGGLDPGTRGDRYQVVVHVEAAALEAENEEGQSVMEGRHVSAETSRRLACDCAKVVMTHGPDGSILDVGRRTRTIPPALRRALAVRDGGCRFPGCGLKLCEATMSSTGPTAVPPSSTISSSSAAATTARSTRRATGWSWPTVARRSSAGPMEGRSLTCRRPPWSRSRCAGCWSGWRRPGPRSIRQPCRPGTGAGVTSVGRWSGFARGRRALT
jgi:hypothetical protein